MEYFVAVVDHGGVTRAANALYIAQPSLSQAIRSLERELGVELFDRSGRTMTLTSAGEVFEDGARKALRDVELAERRVHAVRDLDAGRLRIAATPSLALDPLPAAVAALRKAHPRIQLHITEPDSPADVVNEVRLARAEIGLTTLGGPTAPLHEVVLGQEELGFVVSATHAAELPEQVTLADMARVPLLTEPSDADAERLIETAAREHGGHIAVRTAHRQAVWELVQAGVGGAVMPTELARTRIRHTQTFSFDPPVVRTIGVVHRKAPLSPAARAFMALVRQPLTQPSPLPGR